MTSADGDSRVLRHKGCLWKPTSDASPPAAEFVEARELFIRLYQESLWNPWVLDDHAEELDRAQAVMEQWTRAEPGFTYTTIAELEQRWACEDEERAARRAEDDRRRQQRQARYEPDREGARLALLEEVAHLTIEQRRRDELSDGTAMPADRRSAKIAECDAAVSSIQAEVDRLRGIVGDPETVLDEQGRLPAERRQLSWTRFCAQRSTEVRELRAEIANLDATLRQTRGRAERAAVRKQIEPKKWRLDEWLAITPLEPEDMCADCVSPAWWHHTGRLNLIGEGPCSAWPQWAARSRRAREMIMASASASASASATATATATATRPAEPESKTPKPQSLAVIPSGLPIDEVISRLTALRAQYPHAQVRRGRANRWELWPSDDTAVASRSHG